MYPEYMKNYYESIKGRQHNRKINKRPEKPIYRREYLNGQLMKKC